MLSKNGRDRLETLAGRFAELDSAGIIKAGWLCARVRAKAVRLLRAETVRQAQRRGWFGRLKASAGRLIGRGGSPDRVAKRFVERLQSIITEAGEAGQARTLERLEGLVSEHWQLTAIEQAMRTTLLDVLDLPLDALEGEAFEAMLTAAIYRFAYGAGEAVDFHNRARTTDTSGAYLVYLKEAGSGLVERRILAWTLLEQRFRYDGAVRAVELSRENGALIIRAGVVIPNQGHDAMTLSESLGVEAAETWLRETFGEGEEPLFIAADLAQRPEKAQTQSHRLAFLSVRTRSPGEILGAFLDGERHGQLVGRRLKSGELTPDLVASLGRLTPGAQGASMSDDDRTLVASLPRLSIDSDGGPKLSLEAGLRDQLLRSATPTRGAASAMEGDDG